MPRRGNISSQCVIAIKKYHATCGMILFNHISSQYATSWHIELIKKYHVTKWLDTFLIMLILCSIKFRLILFCSIKPRNLVTSWHYSFQLCYAVASYIWCHCVAIFHRNVSLR